jgi:hypothetical protein
MLDEAEMQANEARTTEELMNVFDDPFFCREEVPV